MIDLLDFTKEISRRIPKTEDDPLFVLQASEVPDIPKQFQSNSLRIKKSIHEYVGTFRIDHLHFHANKSTYEALAVILLLTLMSQKTEVTEIYLCSEQSDIRKIRISCFNVALESPDLYGLYLKPNVYAYTPGEIYSKPWIYDNVVNTSDPRQFPSFDLTNEKGWIEHPEEWDRRDILEGFGSVEGCNRLISLLLDFSRPASTTNEILLETEGGFRGVAPLSCEAHFWLPGADGYI